MTDEKMNACIAKNDVVTSQAYLESASRGTKVRIKIEKCKGIFYEAVCHNQSSLTAESFHIKENKIIN
jgi:hypothetical protein